MFLKAITVIGVMVCLNAQNAVATRGDVTWYNLGLTACGTWHTDQELVAAIGTPYWTTPNPNLDPICKRRATVRDPKSGRSVTVAIQDKCMSCGSNNIDLSPAAFKALRPLDVGRFQGEWNLH